MNLHKYKNQIVTGIIGASTVLAIVLIYSVFIEYKSDKVESQVTYTLADNIIGIKDDTAYLYDVNEKNTIDELNMKDIIGQEVRNVYTDDTEKIEEKEEVQDEPVEEDIEGYDKIEVEIVNQDTSWDIQRKLTPNADIMHMMDLLSQINTGDISLIFPGEKRYFLKEKDSSQAEKETTVYKSSDILNDTVNDDSSSSVVTEDKNIELTNFLYYTSSDFEKIYVYNDYSNEFAEIFVDSDKNKLESKVLYKNTDGYNINEFKVEDGNVYALTKNKKNFFVFSSDGIKKIDVQDTVKQWSAIDNKIYFLGNDDYICVADAENNQIDKIDLGEKSDEIYRSGDYICILNEFGNVIGKSVIQKFNADSDSKGWIEVDSPTVKNIKTASDEEITVLIKDRDDNEKVEKLLYKNLDPKSDNNEKEVAVKNMYKEVDKYIYKLGVLYKNDSGIIKASDSRNIEIASEDVNYDVYALLYK